MDLGPDFGNFWPPNFSRVRGGNRPARAGNFLAARATSWANPSGSTLIGLLNSAPENNPAGPQWTQVGVITKGRFKPLSFPLASGTPLPNAIAW